MNIDNKINIIHESKLYNFNQCDYCNKIIFKIINCSKCNKKICNSCINIMTNHYISKKEEHEIILCYPEFSIITNNIAIGNHKSLYDSFDIIVNLNYPENNVNHMEIIEKQIDNKQIYLVGIKDHPNEKMFEILIKLIPKLLLEYDKNKNNKILFHCNQGISRSVSIAILFISLTQNITLDTSYQLIKSIRPIALPNLGFIKDLYAYIATMR